MRIFKAPKARSHYVAVPNDFIRRADVSRDAKALLIELMSHVDGFTVSVERLQNEHNGRDKVRRQLAELHDHRLVVRVQTRAEGGLFGANDVMLSWWPIVNAEIDEFVDEATSSTVDGFSDDGLTDDGESPPKKNREKKNKEKNNNDVVARKASKASKFLEGKPDWWPVPPERPKPRHGMMPDQLFTAFKAVAPSGPGLYGQADLVNFVTAFWAADEINEALEQLRGFPDCRYPVKFFCTQLPGDSAAWAGDAPAMPDDVAAMFGGEP